MSFHLKVAARQSPLSQAQVEEVLQLIRRCHPHLSFEKLLVKTLGDRDRCTSLRTLGQTDFFTKEVDELVLSGQCHVGIHSAKDLPVPLTTGLELIAITEGIDPSDSLVMREALPPGALVATSSQRREEAVKQYYPDASFVDLRGTIAERLEKLERCEVHGVVVAEAALIRLGLTHLSRQRLSAPTSPLQGKLAIVSRQGDEAMKQLFAEIDCRETHPSSRA